ncbi:MAG: TldD/PmbA family protein [Peptococcaceae bacterium]|jgi:TldD protein|nr:TldD/PmbA family protein [Peptococcaceae bacterium]MDH7525362.1 TldD/PmbA family protein [Peptococcaceae bacterium]
MDKKVILEVLKKALRHGADFAELFWEHKETSTIGCEENRIERINSGIDEGAGIRVICGDSTSYAYTNELSLDRLLVAAEIAGKVAWNKEKREREIKFFTPKTKAGFDIEVPPGEVKMETKAGRVLEASEAARRIDPRIRQVSVGYSDVRQQVIVANSEGVYVEDLRTRTRLSVNAVATGEGIVQTGYFTAGGTTGFEMFKENDPAEIGEKAARRAVLMLSAGPAPAGKMPVVISGQAGGTMIHEACGHGLEADLVQKGLSVYAGKKGKQVASLLVTVVDDGLLAGKYGSIRYDDEGCPAQKTVLIRNGVLEEFMYDYQTARREGRESTGNGRRESYHNRPLPRMRNTYIAPGKTDPERIIKETKEGLLVTAMGGGQVNTTNGDYVFDVAEAYLIRDGEVACPVRGATLTGNGPETLQLVEMVGKDWGFSIGVCGKDGQGVPVSDAQPTLAVKELIVGGRGNGRPNGRIRRL